MHSILICQHGRFDVRSLSATVRNTIFSQKNNRLYIFSIDMSDTNSVKEVGSNVNFLFNVIIARYVIICSYRFFFLALKLTISKTWFL